MTVARFVDSLSYKPGWRFKLGGPLNTMLCVYALTPDSNNPARERVTQHQFVIPDESDMRVLARWVRDRLLDIERHECCEFLAIAGHRPFYPNHGDAYADIEHWPNNEGV